MLEKLAFIILMSITAIFGMSACDVASAPTHPETKVERITEDDPRWDCATMGNKVCG